MTHEIPKMLLINFETLGLQLAGLLPVKVKFKKEI